VGQAGANGNPVEVRHNGNHPIQFWTDSILRVTLWKTQTASSFPDRTDAPVITNEQMLPNTISSRWRAAMCFAASCLLLVVCLRCEAQNLVPNPSFEDSDSCREVLGFFSPTDGPLGWFSASGSPDHLQSCLPYGAANGLPMSAMTFQNAQDGNSCVGVITHSVPEEREYVMAQLQSPLTVGQTYFVSFYANAAFGGNQQYPQFWLATSNIGVLFTVNSREWEQGDPFPNLVNAAHVSLPAILADTAGWTLVDGSFVADSAYEYLMIGNHFSNALTDTLHLGQSTVWYPRSYTLIDNVCVSEDPTCALGMGVEDHWNIGLWVLPNPSSDAVCIKGVELGSTVLIKNFLGETIFVQRAQKAELMLDVSQWPSGSYFVALQGAGKRKATQFVVIDQ
jgi:hypothetical protein